MALQQICGIANACYMKETLRMSAIIEDMLESDTSNLSNNLQLAAPPFEDPAVNLQNYTNLRNDNTTAAMKIDYDHGTTTLGFIYQGGVVLAVDSRATGGQYIGSQSMKKIVEINAYMLGTMAGGAADCVYWDRVLTKECRLHELRNKEAISTNAASRIMANICHHYKGMGLSMGMMLGAYDHTGPKLIYVDSDGARTSGNMFSVGSGSVYAMGILDTTYRENLTREEAIELGQRAIYHATCKDAYSGGIVRVYHIDQHGWKNISNIDCADLHYNYAAKKQHELEAKEKMHMEIDSEAEAASTSAGAAVTAAAAPAPAPAVREKPRVPKRKKMTDED